MKISYTCYKYAPETARATVNGIKLNLDNTMIPELIATGRKAEAEKELKKLYRRTLKADNNYIYAFFAENSTQFYYISCLNFKANADIKSRLYCYKELKQHLKANPIEIITESGHISPIAAEDPEVKKEIVKIDFKKCRKIKIA